MQIQINAAARLNHSQQVRAATAEDAGKVVLWIQKAVPGIKGKKRGRAGKQEGMEFKAGKGDRAVNLRVLLDHTFEPPRLLLEGDWAGGDTWRAEEKTGRKTIMKFKEAMRETAEHLKGDPEFSDVAAILKNLLKTKSKIETE